MDRGVQRRLVVVPFNRIIPREDRIPDIGKRCAEEEPDLLLAYTVGGAARLVKNRAFTNPESCNDALTDWLFSADPVLGWINEQVERREVVDDWPKLATREAFGHFSSWAVENGFKSVLLPSRNNFTQRVKGAGILYKRRAEGGVFIGISSSPSLYPTR
jgi:putative DNA primase/helicase